MPLVASSASPLATRFSFFSSATPLASFSPAILHAHALPIAKPPSAPLLRLRTYVRTFVRSFVRSYDQLFLASRASEESLASGETYFATTRLYHPVQFLKCLGPARSSAYLRPNLAFQPVITSAGCHSLPTTYTRVEMGRFELPTSSVQGRRSPD